MIAIQIRPVGSHEWEIVAWLWQWSGLLGERRSLTAMWVAPVVRREGTGLGLALNVIGRHPGPWSVAFQHENVEAGGFWRRVADEAFGREGWREEEEPVPGVPGAPSDHWIHSG